MVIKDVCKYYADQLVFEHIQASIAIDDRIGFVGENGIGKTTLLRILAGLEPYEKGQIIKGQKYRIGYLQQLLINSKETLGDYLGQTFAGLLALKAEMDQLEKQLAQTKIDNDSKDLDRLMKQYALAQQKWEEGGGYNYQVEIKRVAFGLGFTESDLDKSLDTFSGGQQMRAQLTRLLLENPDLLLLDEPTNHLDINALEWLESFLPTYPKAVLVVSHDRYFLDRVVNRIWELQDFTLYTYKGNYSAYQGQRQQRIDQAEDLRQKQQTEREKIAGFIRKFGSGTRAKQAKSLEKRLDKLEPVKQISKDPHMRIRLQPKRITGIKVVTLKNITKGYDQPVLSGVNGEITRGERIALLGPNGCGKTTLLKILANALDYQGEITWGVNVDPGYFSQNISFTEQGTVLDELYAAHRGELGELRSILARFLFRGDDVFKAVSILSGGERNRLAMAKLLLAAPNFLLLDEPTNHLDIYARSALEAALLDFGGTVLFVSHDRYFVNALATKLWILDKGTIRVFEGTYAKYRQVLQESSAQVKQATQSDYKHNQRFGNQQKNLAKKRLERQVLLEQKIIELEAKQKAFEALLADSALYQDELKSKATVAEYHRVRDQLEHVYQEWGALDDE